MLYLVATPIGHLADMSQRAIDVLKSCDRILCEDTRHSRILLDHYEIHQPLSSFHQFNEKRKENELIEALKMGQTIAIISDAGTPLISDPGGSLVSTCIRENIPFTYIPGPCSLIHALLLSGFSTEPFQFIGFLPRTASLLKKTLLRAFFFSGTTVAFESPNRLVSTLEMLTDLDPEREIAVARELTKAHEECLRGKSKEILAHFRITPPRGEIALVISQGKELSEALEIDELISLLREFHNLSLRDAIKMAAKISKTKKNTIYQNIHHEKNCGDSGPRNR